MTFLNEGAWDRAIRILLAIVVGYAAWFSWPGALAVFLAAVAGIALVTGVVGWCPAYTVFGISTKKTAA